MLKQQRNEKVPERVWARIQATIEEREAEVKW